MFTTIDKIDTERILESKTEFKTVGDAKYYDLSLCYLYDNNSRGRLSIELPLVKSRGIFKKEQDKLVNGVQKKITKYAMLFTFDANNEEHQKTIEVLKKIYTRTRKILGSVKDKTGLFLKYFNGDQEECGTYQSFVKYPIDKKTNKLIEGATPAIWVKLYNFEDKRGSHFFDLNSELVEWELLENVEMEICPLIDFSKLYIGTGAIYLQYYVASGVITDINQLTSTNRQSSTLESLSEKYQDKIEDLERKLSKMREDHKEELDKVKNSDYTDTSKTPSSGLTDFLNYSNNDGGMGTMTPRSLTNIPRISKYE